MHPIAEKYLRKTSLPSIYCPGCGHGTVLNAFLRVVDDLDIMDDLGLVGGIGCSSWTPVFVNTDVLHTLHGRTVAFATGAKMYNPNLQVMVISGDGDLADIGGNHLIHAARRNMDLTVILVNNFLYGMTGGQAACTTPMGAFTMTTTQGNPYRPFDLCKLVGAAGAAYTARYSVTQPLALVSSIKKALQTKGFSFIEVVSSCPTQFGRRNQIGTPAEMIEYLMEKCITKEEAEGLSPEEREGKIVTGEFSYGRD